MKNFILALLISATSFLHAATFWVKNTNEGGTESFKKALNDANRTLGTDTVLFDLPGTGPFHLGTSSEEFILTESVFIDGLSQAGNVKGNLILNTKRQLVISASHVTIKGLKFDDTGWKTWILVEPPRDESIEFIHIDQNQFELKDQSIAVKLTTNVNRSIEHVRVTHNHMIGRMGTGLGVLIFPSGGSTPISMEHIYLMNNVIDNAYDGISIYPNATQLLVKDLRVSENEIMHCIYGIDVSLGATGNSRITVDSLLITKNHIHSCEYAAIDMSLSPKASASFAIDQILIQQNEMSQNERGINIRMSGSCSLLQSHISFGDSRIEENIIYDNSVDGIILANHGGISPQAINFHGISLLKNAVYNNGGAGIWVRDYFFQNAQTSMFQTPQIDSISENNGVYQVTGELKTAVPATEYWIEFFASTHPDTSGRGEGEVYLGRDTIVTDINGNAMFGFTTTENIGYQYITATSTQVNKGNTSEFGNALSLYSPGVGIEASDAFSFEVFPNPAHDFLHLKWTPAQHFRELRICSVDGKNLFTQSVKRQNHTAEIPVKTLPIGTYFVILQDEAGRLFSRIWVKSGE